MKKTISIFKRVLLYIIIGFPLMFIKSFLLYIKNGNLWRVWDIISPYKNIKLVFLNGAVIRNMQKAKPLMPQFIKVFIQESPSEKGLYELEKGLHAISYNKMTKIGITYSTKQQKSFDNPVKSENNEVALAQKFQNTKMSIELSMIKNEKLIKALQNSEVDVAHANLLISEKTRGTIIVNKDNKQYVEMLTEKQQRVCAEFIKDLGEGN